MKKLVKVTKEHINNGINDATLCPVALALKFFLKTPFVSDHINDRFTDLEYHYPRSVERFVYKFDSGKPVKPFNFYLKEK